MRNRATTFLRQTKVRQSWSKYNLYNLYRLRSPNNLTKSFFQQKFHARTLARTYHGEQVPERQWTRMFSRRIRSVVPMNAARLARDDGSQASAGRGSGLDPHPAERPFRFRRTPFMQMAFAPLERRLDVAIFRALFASSTRQARQFVIHGSVTVNGEKMRYPGYLLNPGDLFQVDPERVLYATGARKDRQQRRSGRRRAAGRKAANKNEKAAESATEQKEGEKPESKAEAEGQEEGQTVKSETVTEATTEGKEDQTEAKTKEKKEATPKETLKRLLDQAKTIMSNDREALPARRRQELLGFRSAVRRVLSRSDSSSVLADNLEGQFAQLISLLNAKKISDKEPKNKRAEAAPARESSDEATKATDNTPADNRPSEALTDAFRKATLSEEGLDEQSTSELSDEEFTVLKRALIQMRDNPVDASKPYATPWRPRDYMSAFAFIPRYLEVNQNICAAVYVRHPVARPGYSEVPTPFSEETGTHAFTWYLRRR